MPGRLPRIRHRLLAGAGTAALVVSLALVHTGVASAGESDGDTGWAHACQSLEHLALPDGAQIVEVEATADGTLSPPDTSEAFDDLPPLCRVRGRIPQTINFEVWMPAPGGWNDRFQGVGNGGFAGSISYDAMASAVRDGFASASTDTGTRGRLGSVWDDNLIADFGHRAIHAMTDNAKSIVAEFYGEDAAYSYFAGCSTGGRQGMMETQRYPDDYDGVISGAPAIDMSSFQGSQIWAAQVTKPVGSESFIEECKLPHIAAAVLEACDGLGDSRME